MKKAPSRLWRWGKRGLITVGVLLAVALAPVLWVESSCYENPAPTEPFKTRLRTADQRQEINSYLTYPEWSIVHAYQDLAAVSARSSESDFRYLSSIASYWSSLCNIVGYASERGIVSGEYRTMLHVIGVSFSAEMFVKGLYEKTIGRFSVWTRGKDKTPEDEFAQKVADDYAVFLHQTPWYEYPFGERLKEFWTTTPFGAAHFIRRIERRFALTLEFGFKAVYARGMAVLAEAAAAPLSIRSIVTGGGPADVAGVKIIDKLRDGARIIETPRYAKFTQIMRQFAKSGIDFVEIAGNDTIMVGLLAPPKSVLQFASATVITSVPVEFKPGWRRYMVNVDVASLSQLIRYALANQMAVEHVYDY